MILAGDIGGTNTRLGLFKRSEKELHLVYEKKQASSCWQDPVDLLHEFLKDAGIQPKEIETGCLSLAGPIGENFCHLTNLNRAIDLEYIRKSLNIKIPLHFCNDLMALGYGLPTLNSSQLYCLASGKKMQCGSDPASLNRAILAPGTGLGESLIIDSDSVIPSEGAHADFAPRSELEVRLWRFLHQELGHVSNERILSGPGLINLYHFFLSEDEANHKASPLPTPQKITKKAINKSCPYCQSALDLFLEILGAEAGNLALRSLAYGGIYLGGGIVPKLLPQLRESSFLKAFYDKGRFHELLSSIPVYVILEEQTALYGAARYALLTS
ncbi:glucokinase [Desulfitobacterium sp.]|uniref:glucokinase n=1 Tax=Desulfitobacterium sp. TaxID=49981 RepID=UPI002B1FDE38|nr:glucokinase [Desulfitobacterium sp.]MEA4903168.1 glucokinase [Desulfitobacterium sp.]